MGSLSEFLGAHDGDLIDRALQSLPRSSPGTPALPSPESRKLLECVLASLRGVLEASSSSDGAYDTAITAGSAEIGHLHLEDWDIAEVLPLFKACRRAARSELDRRKGTQENRARAHEILEGYFDGLEMAYCASHREPPAPEHTQKLQSLLRYRGDLSRLISEISTEFVGLTPEQTDSAIESALGRIGQFAAADTAYAVRFSEDGKRFSVSHLWRSSHSVRPAGNVDELNVLSMSWWMQRLRESEVVVVGSIDEVPKDALVERGFIQSQGIESLLGVPLSVQDAVVGFIAISSHTRGRRWSDDETYLVRIFGQVLTNALRRQHAEEMIARERLLLRALIDNLPDYIFVKDTRSRFILNNAAHLRLLRAESAEAVAGKTDFDIFPKPLATRYFADEQAVIQTREPLVNREEQVVDEQKHKLWLMTTKVPFTDAQGNVAGIVGMSRNITERKHMEEAIKSHSKLLEQANADLKRRNQDLDEFTYVASHDLQEPLRKLTAFSDALREDLDLGDREAVLKDLDVLSSGAQRMQRLVQDLLALSRSGRQKMNVAATRIEHCVSGALDALEIRIRETKAEISRAKMPVVRGDASMLTQLYQNLIGNALKFCDADHPCIELTAEQSEGNWTLGVRDNGIGIKPEYAKQIFAPFKRLHGRGRYEGTGIGLAICRKIVERHGGAIWVESELGQGAHFKFTLPEK